MLGFLAALEYKDWFSCLGLVESGKESSHCINDDPWVLRDSELNSRALSYDGELVDAMGQIVAGFSKGLLT